MEYQVGDKVLIKSLDWYNKNKDKYGHVHCDEHGYDFVSHMSAFCGKILTIDVDFEDGTYLMKEDTDGFVFTDEMIEGKVEEETKPELDYVTAMEDLMGLEIEKNCILNEFDEYKKAVEEHGYFSEEALSCKYFIHLRKIGTAQNILEKFGFNLPEGYIFKDENGNVINTTKIVLEKKKKEYPKTYEECCEILQYNKYLKVYPPFNADVPAYDVLGLFNSLEALRKLRVCRDAYWKIAGEEMGLGKPWEPDWNDGCYVIFTNGDGLIERDIQFGINAILAFPTEEMRDAFKENFDQDIEICKEFL